MIIKTVVFALDCLHCFALDASQDGPKRPRSPPKSIQESSLCDLKKLETETGSKFYLLVFWTHVEAVFGLICTQKSPQNLSIFFSHIDPEKQYFG